MPFYKLSLRVYRMAENGPLIERTKLPFYQFINRRQFTDILSR